MRLTHKEIRRLRGEARELQADWPDFLRQRLLANVSAALAVNLHRDFKTSRKAGAR